MTDGAARLCQLLAGAAPELREPLGHLTSRSPARFWTSGQWMTEAGGGSDVAGATATLARPLQPAADGVGRCGVPRARPRPCTPQPVTHTHARALACTSPPHHARRRSWYSLTGFKWFTSAADGEVAMALARECGPDGRPLPGTAGLTLFYVPVRRDEHGTPLVGRRLGGHLEVKGPLGGGATSQPGGTARPASRSCPPLGSGRVPSLSRALNWSG